MAGLLEEPSNTDRRSAKFGGHPDWIERPAWPLGPDGSPMVFLAQFPTLDRSRMLYVFYADQDRNWEPLGPANAVVAQPGAAPQTPTRESTAGPQLFLPIERADRYTQPTTAHPYERFIDLQPGADPPVWQWPDLGKDEYLETRPDDWRKLGGTPLFLQGEDWPPGDGWEFAFQFTAGWAGHEFGDVAECYGFVNTDGRGAFLWQCH